MNLYYDTLFATRVEHNQISIDNDWGNHDSEHNYDVKTDEVSSNFLLELSFFCSSVYEKDIYNPKMIIDFPLLKVSAMIE